ncbi:MAG TPA: lactate utilization protein C [Trueperaceae bacterium]
MSARSRILERIRAATGPQVDGLDSDEVSRDYLMEDDGDREARVRRFTEVVSDYRARVIRVTEAEVPASVALACERRGARRLIVPEGFPEEWLPGTVERLPDDLGNEELSTAHGVLTTCALAIAQTGTLVLDGGPGQGRRAATLLPDFHLCVVRASQIEGIVPQAVARIEGSIAAGRPVTFISGPSATSDIELSRVEGVHGPRTLEVLVVDESVD